ESMAIDFAEPNKFLQCAERSWSVIIFAGQLNEPVHAQLREHRRFDPGLLIAGQHVVRRDLRGSCPMRDLIEPHRPESASVLMFAEKPPLTHRKLIASQGDEEPEAAGEAVGITMAWPACNLRPSSM